MAGNINEASISTDAVNEEIEPDIDSGAEVRLTIILFFSYKG